MKKILTILLLVVGLMLVSSSSVLAASTGPANGVIGVPTTSANGNQGVCHVDFQGQHYVANVNSGATEYSERGKPNRLVCNFTFGTFPNKGREFGTNCVDNLNAPNGEPQSITFGYWRLVTEADGRGELVCKNNPF